ncbi:MAG TPA: type II toxin-antitoxin system RelE/ParE family toxin [Bacteroidales bacterium]|nr:type II toxin-antitoxin system RelE/ParE family toxin [Bacteroidales bacterium]
MIITFADRTLMKYANDQSLAKRKLGVQQAELFHRRLEDLRDSESFADLEHLPGNHHQLKFNRKDQWSCDLNQPYRLIYIPAYDPVPKDEDGRQLLKELTAVRILEINNYHKEGKR